jgi:hypothetical protein
MKTKKGRPVKASGGLTKVLYVRVHPELLVGLDRLVESRRKKEPWLSISRADVARELIYRGVWE